MPAGPAPTIATRRGGVGSVIVRTATFFEVRTTYRQVSNLAEPKHSASVAAERIHTLTRSVVGKPILSSHSPVVSGIRGRGLILDGPQFQVVGDYWRYE